MKTKVIAVFLLFLLALGGAWFVFFHNQNLGKGLTKVIFRLDWASGAEHSFLYWAKEKGLFEKEGLDVEIQPGDGSTTAAKLVGNKTVDFALCSGDTALIAATSETPVRPLAVLYSRTPTVVFSRKDKNILAPKDLEGKKYGANMKSTTYKQFVALCSVAGIDINKIQVISTAGKAEDILTDAVDASGGYTYIQPIQCELASVSVNEIFLADHGVKCYSMSIISNNNAIPDVSRRLIGVSIKAFEEMLKDNSAMLEVYFRVNPTANKDFEKAKLKRLTDFINQNLKTQGSVGKQTLEGWQQTQDFLLAQDLIKTKIDLPKFFTNEFLP